ncbi:DMT family transporter [bacterium]|nr:DMT family transporter [bacterium]
MDNLLLFAILGGLGAMIGWGTNGFLTKKTVDKIGGASALFWMQIIGLFLLLLIFPFQFDISDLTFSNILLIAFWAIIDGAGLLLLFSASEKGKISIISPIVASYAAFSVFVSAIAFGEAITPQTLFFLALIFVGIILTSLDFQQLKKDVADRGNLMKGVPQAALSVVFFAFWFPFWDDFVSKGNSWLTLLIGLRIFIALLVFLFTKYKSISLRIKDSKILKWLICMGILDVGAYLALTWSYSESNYTSVISILSAAFSVPTLILARVFLKERLKISQWIGVGIIIGSLVLMAGLSAKL